MTLRKLLFYALLVYVALDLSLPAMPGAFVFEPEQSVDSAQTGRTRVAADVIGALGAPMGVSVLMPVTFTLYQAVISARDAPRPWRRPGARRPRVVAEAAPGSEDPH